MNQNRGRPFWDFLEDEPETGYFGYQNQWRTPNQRRYFQGQFDEIQNEYLGRLGQQIMRGGQPDLRMNQNRGPFWNFLEDEPEAAYFGYQPQWRTPNQRRYFQGQFNAIRNEYLGRFGQQIMRGGEPDLRFTDFLSQIPWTERFMQLPPSLRGDNPSLFNPRTRFMF